MQVCTTLSAVPTSAPIVVRASSLIRATTHKYSLEAAGALGNIVCTYTVRFLSSKGHIVPTAAEFVAWRTCGRPGRADYIVQKRMLLALGGTNTGKTNLTKGCWRNRVLADRYYFLLTLVLVDRYHSLLTLKVRPNARRLRRRGRTLEGALRLKNKNILEGPFRAISLS